MFFFCIGLPGYFTEWCHAITARLVERALGPTQGLYADSGEQLLVSAIGASMPHLIVGSCHIAGRLWTSLAEANRKFVLVLDDPISAIQDLVEGRQGELLDTTRTVAGSCASMTSCMLLPGALVLDRRRDAGDPAVAVAAIAQHFEIPVDAAGIREVIASLEAAEPTPEPANAEEWWDSLDERERAVIAGAIDPYRARFDGGELEPITWERELFYLNEEPAVEPNPPASRPIDLTGRPRHIVHGPYITLPPGAWSVGIALGFSPEAAQLTYLVNVATDTVLSEITVQPDGARLLDVNLSFALAEPSGVTIHVCTERAAFDGRLALGHVVVAPSGAIRAETRDYLATVLEG
jgi:hypothetical protein